MKLSARNQIPARITAINSGEAIANVELAGDHRGRRGHLATAARLAAGWRSR